MSGNASQKPDKRNCFQEFGVKESEAGINIVCDMQYPLHFSCLVPAYYMIMYSVIGRLSNRYFTDNKYFSLVCYKNTVNSCKKFAV